jgi:hypothetical protein
MPGSLQRSGPKPVDPPYFVGIRQRDQDQEAVMQLFRSIAAVVTVSFALTGCGTTPGCRALTGAGLGAAGGALIGAVGGNVVAGAVTGGVVGAAIGGLTSAKQIHAGRGPCR